MSAVEMLHRNPQSQPPESNGAPEIPGESVGRTLKRAREAYSQDLQSVAEALRIRFVYLDAIEAGRHADLPGPAYAVGFVRTYAEFLGLDSAVIVARFKQEIEGLESGAQLHFLTPAAESRIPGGAVFIVCAVVAAVGYGAWYYLSHFDREVAELIPAVPERMQALIENGQELLSSASRMSVHDGRVTVTGPEPATTEATPRAGSEDKATPAETVATTSPLPPTETGTLTSEAAATTDTPATSDMDAVPSSARSVSDASAAPEEEATVEAAGAGVAGPEEPAVNEIAEDGPAAVSVGRSEDPVNAQTPRVEDTANEVTESAAVSEERVGLESVDAEVQGGPAARVIGSSPSIPAVPTQSSDLSFLTEHEPIVYGENNRESRVRLVATQDSWVQVRDSEGDLLLTRVLRAGDSYRVPNRSGLTLLTGNAGGLHIEVDDARLPALGTVGAVRRDIPLDPESLLAGMNPRR